MSAGELHAIPLADAQWWACHHPERPAERWRTSFDHRCRACLIAMRAAFETGRIDPDWVYLQDEVTSRVMRRATREEVESWFADLGWPSGVH